MVLEGQEISVKVTINNTGSVSHEFPIGMTIRHIATNQDFNLPLQLRRVAVGNNGFKTFNWIVPSGAPKGLYSIISAVWEGEENGIPFNRLDDWVSANAFAVQ